MNNQTSMGSIELTDKELAGVSGGKKARVIVMEPVTIVVFTRGSTIKGRRKNKPVDQDLKVGGVRAAPEVKARVNGGLIDDHQV